MTEGIGDDYKDTSTKHPRILSKAPIQSGFPWIEHMGQQHEVNKGDFTRFRQVGSIGDEPKPQDHLSTFQAEDCLRDSQDA